MRFTNVFHLHIKHITTNFICFEFERVFIRCIKIKGKKNKTYTHKIIKEFFKVVDVIMPTHLREQGYF